MTAVVTTYQSEATIEAAVRSVQAQTLPVAAVVVVDDGSCDETVDRALALGGVDVIELEHSGTVARSRNAAVAASRTEYVAFLDADDVWTPQHIEWTNEIVQRWPELDLVCGNAVRVADGVGERPFFAHLNPRSSYVNGTSPQPISMSDLIRWRPVVTSSVAVRRAALIEAKGFAEDRALAGSEDFKAWCSVMARNGARGMYDPRVHVRYNAVEESLTRGAREDRGRAATIRALHDLIDDSTFESHRRVLRGAVARDRVTWARRCFERGDAAQAAHHLICAIRRR